MSECSNKELGSFLHAYELGILSDEDRNRFEIHVLECDYCYERLTGFEERATILRQSRSIRELAQQLPGGDPATGTFFRKLGSYLWPDKPILFRPALLYLVIIALLIPVTRGLWLVSQDGRTPPVRPRLDEYALVSPTSSPYLSLVPTRSGSPKISLSSNWDGRIRFVHPDAVPGKPFDIRITAQDGSQLLELAGFRGFNEYGAAEAILPMPLIGPGQYRVVIRPVDSGDFSTVQEYRFLIVE